MTAPRVLATLLLLVTGWLGRRRPLLLLLAGLGLHQLWCETAAHRDRPTPTSRALRVAARRQAILPGPASSVASHRR